MDANGTVTYSVDGGIATITFSHPKGNSLPGSLLRRMAEVVDECSQDQQARVVLLRSEGNKSFCGGASFDELLAVETEAQGKEFFMGFARLILAMRRCPKFIITRVQGRAVGGGVGVISASDYALAMDTASIRLSELALGLGPFVVGPAVEKRVGFSAFSALAIDATSWRDANWALEKGFYADIFGDIHRLDEAVGILAKTLAASNPEAMAELKRNFSADTAHWNTLLEERAAISGRLVLSEFTSRALSAYRAKKK